MTAEELIKKLKTLPPQTPVLAEGYETGYDDIVDFKAEDVFRYRSAQEWDGEYQKPVELFGKGSKTVPAAVIVGLRRPLR